MDAGLSAFSGLAYVPGTSSTPPTPPTDLGILREGSITDFLMLEGNVYYLLQE